MTTITIPLSEDRIAQLQVWAQQSGLSPEEFLRQLVEKILEPPDDEFRKTVDYVFKKNAELYRRLAGVAN